MKGKDIVFKNKNMYKFISDNGYYNLLIDIIKTSMEPRLFLTKNHSIPLFSNKQLHKLRAKKLKNLTASNKSISILLKHLTGEEITPNTIKIVRRINKINMISQKNNLLKQKSLDLIELENNKIPLKLNILIHEFSYIMDNLNTDRWKDNNLTKKVY